MLWSTIKGNAQRQCIRGFTLPEVQERLGKWLIRVEKSDHNEVGEMIENCIASAVPESVAKEESGDEEDRDEERVTDTGLEGNFLLMNL